MHCLHGLQCLPCRNYLRIFAGVLCTPFPPLQTVRKSDPQKRSPKKVLLHKKTIVNRKGFKMDNPEKKRN